MKSLVNNITALNQQIYLDNLSRVTDKPYKSFFRKDLYLHDDIIRQVQSAALPLDQVTYPYPDDLNQMLTGDLWQTTGYAVLEDGTRYAASLTRFPNCSAEMLEWWFWWHSVEPERYTLWYPYCHISVEAKNKTVFNDPTLSHREKYIGNTHFITEYLNDRKNNIAIEFVPPEALGFEKKVLDEAQITATACGYVYLQKPKVLICKMVHLFKETAKGGVLISRYYLGDHMALVVGHQKIRLPKFLKKKFLTSNGSGIQMAYEQVMHDQIEFTHLASILPELFHQFGKA